jgi:hypothetical protein
VGQLDYGIYIMSIKVVAATFICLSFGQSVIAQDSNWRTYYKSPISTFETNKWAVDDVKVSFFPGAKIAKSSFGADSADIVWFGEGTGNTGSKVRSIVEEATRAGSRKLKGSRKVVFDIVVLDFKSPTPRVRRAERTDIGVHHVNISISVRDSKTGQVLLAPTIVEADLEALTGSFAKAFEEQRQGQKERVTQHLASVVQGFLGQGPDPRRRFTRVAG